MTDICIAYGYNPCDGVIQSVTGLMSNAPDDLIADPLSVQPETVRRGSASSWTSWTTPYQSAILL